MLLWQGCSTQADESQMDIDDEGDQLRSPGEDAASPVGEYIVRQQDKSGLAMSSISRNV